MLEALHVHQAFPIRIIPFHVIVDRLSLANKDNQAPCQAMSGHVSCCLKDVLDRLESYESYESYESCVLMPGRGTCYNDLQ
jgi:hypothetical protein